jgi:hypothetical protein
MQFAMENVKKFIFARSRMNWYAVCHGKCKSTYLCPFPYELVCGLSFCPFLDELVVGFTRAE